MGTGQFDKDTLEILVVNHPAGNSIRDLITTEERDILVTKMDILGYRPLELSELIILGIVKPEFFKAPRKEVLNTYKRYTLNNCDRFPVLYRLGDIRYLDASRPAGAWGHGDRFLFIRKWSKE